MIFENVQNALAQQFEVEPETITMDTNLIDDLGADSLDVVELIMSLEDMYGISISDDDATQLYTVSKIVDYLEGLNK
ncbi:MAG: acyl carrier protein [Candidatus Limivicinus sp.]|jgi:acyl carrier protein